MPNLDAANISFNLLKMTGGEGMTVGPILLGAAKPVHILTPIGDGAAAGEHDGVVRGGCERAVAVTRSTSALTPTQSVDAKGAKGKARKAAKKTASNLRIRSAVFATKK